MAKTLRDAYLELTAKSTFKAQSPFLIWLFENPKSPLALPGAISLTKHDYVHCLLEKNLSVKSEAYVIGFTMGSDPRTNHFHVWFFKILSCYVYKKPYGFDRKKHWPVFMEGFRLGRACGAGDLEKFEFENWLDQSVAQLQNTLLQPAFSPAE